MHLLSRFTQWIEYFHVKRREDISSATQDPRLQPLLSAARIQQLCSYAESLPVAALRNLLSHAREAGEQRSSTSGRGIEFEELRPYQPGDDIRDIEWRVSSRRGIPYIKVKREERAVTLQLVVDRRASMRFATRGLLKVTAAVEMAVLLMYAALRLQARVSLTLMQGNGEVRSWDNVVNCTAEVINELVSPCPPPGHPQQQDDWKMLFEQLEMRPGRADWLILLSDYAELDRKHSASLASLAHQHHITALRFIDPVEENLPALGRIRVVSTDAERQGEIDSDSDAMRQQFRQQHMLQRQRLEELFRQYAVNVYYCHTDDAVTDVFHRLAQHG